MSKSLRIPFVLIFLGTGLFFLPAHGLSESTLQYSWNMDSNPGWTTQGLWAWGVPQGLGGGLSVDGYGGPDPTQGHTGSNVYGYNLSGNYEPNLVERHLTTQAIDCTGLTQVVLKFWRWLGVEKYDEISPGFFFGDIAAVSVSNDGINWEVVAQNASANIADTSWHFHEWDISDFADGQATVYLRWTMGPTDTLYNYCGWNIDDVEIWAVSSVTIPTVTTGSATSVTSSSATLNGTVNPNGASTNVVFNYGLTTGYGSTTTASQSPLSGTNAQAVNAGISGFGQGLTYHYRVVATNSAGTTYGSDRTFNTLSCPDCSGPIVENVTFPANKNCECISSTSITMGTGITFETGANVTVKAPTVILKPGFRAPSNARLNIRQP